MAISDRYKNNPFLPKANIKREYSSEEIHEYIKCVEDPVYFAKTYFQIVHLDHGLIPFTLYEYQEEAVRKFQRSRNLILCASRQSGKTSVTTVIILHTALYSQNKTIAILANKGPTARDILKRIKTAYEYIPDFLKPGVKEWNKGRVEFENGSVIMAEASSSDNIRGQSISLLYIDEHAFIRGWDEFSASVLPTLSSGTTTKMVFSSTPHGLNHFYHYVESARKGINDFELVEVPWQRVPGRDEAWRQKTLAELNYDELKFAQEYSLDFQGSSGTLISGSTLKLLEFIEPLNIDKYYKQYEQPVEGHSYMITADVSRGKGLDYSALHVIDITDIPYKQVMTYRNNMITPTDFADIIEKVGYMYNEASVLIEINDLGQQVADCMFDNEYPNLLSTVTKGRKGKQLSASLVQKNDRGVRTTRPVKMTGCSALKLLVEQNKLKVNDKETIHELTVFSQKGNSYEAEPGNHDDLVMGLVIFAWATMQPFFKDLYDSDIMSALREKTEQELEEEMLPLGFVYDGHEDEHEVEVHRPEFDNWMTI